MWFIPIGIGDSITVYPDSTTTYFARVTGICGASLCKSVTIYTKDGSIAPTGIQSTSNNFCTGSSTTLSISGGQLVLELYGIGTKAYAGRIQ